jgi:(1->4)-alpha-D-glucan 1-alpha-D-glucosylmutase
VTAPGARVPSATYRLQLNGGLPFAAAAALVPYLDALGISDVYTSSYLAARPGSPHGYDLVDHNALNPEIGGEVEHGDFVAALRARGMGHLLDVVPNHMGVVPGANRWWTDVLENGPSSPYAEFFDIDWEPVERHLANKLLLPILGDQYGRALERQELTLDLVDGAFVLRYHGTTLPVEPRSAAQVLAWRLSALTAALAAHDPALQEYQSILTALGNLPAVSETAPARVRERQREKEVVRRRLAQLVERAPAIRAALEETLRAFNGDKGDPRSFDLLDRLLDEQPYRLAHWRVAAEEINYRRFFDVNDLAAIRMEHPGVFAETHRLIFRLVEAEQVTGLRIDHPDGLYDPRGYLAALQRERRAQLAGAGGDDGGAGGRPLYVVAEKILARGEKLPANWPVHGTTGYEFLALAGGLFVDPAGARPLAAAAAAFTGQRLPWADLVYACKRLVVESVMAGELSVLGHRLHRLAQRHRGSRDFTRASLTHALREVIACFPLYRTYIGDEGEITLQDRAAVEVAVAYARRRNPTTGTAILDFVRDVLLLREPDGADEAYRQAQRAFVGRFQQLTAPVTAKGVEDTAFYRHLRLVSLNEVGGDPDQFGVSVEDFHRQCAARQAAWPAGLSATATHDTKRGEDARARIHVLSERPAAWREAVRRWHRANRRHAALVEGRPAPDRADEYLFYQTLVGAWPPGAAAAEPELVDRLQAYAIKAAREAKVHTSWISPHEAYEAALRAFVAAALAPGPGNRFVEDFLAFHAPCARLGAVNGLAQLVLKLAAPGVPDLYQGTELWDLSLVDPDNRRPVDWAARRAALETIRARVDAGALAGLAAELLARWEDGHVKLFVLHRGLVLRRRRAALFRHGAYRPLAVSGRHAAHLLAFAREHEGDAALAVVPRLTWRLTGGARWPLGHATWEDTAVVLPPGLAGDWEDVFTGGRPAPGAGGALPAAALLGDFPVALLARRA